MIGKTISHYRILEKLGEGGMGVVYKAEDTTLQRPVALKFLPPDLTRNSAAKQRFIQEACAASALDHPNICTIHEFDETVDGQLFIVMAYYDQESLKSRIERGPLPPAEAMDIAMQVAEGLKKAHSKGIIHRDIKPSNIMITSDGIAKIVDFGLAKLSRGQRLTVDGKTMGTIAYMSPEQTRGDDVDQRSDIWSLGVVLYEMLTGKLPFRGEHDQAIIYSIVNEEPEPLSKFIPDIEASFQQITDKMLSKKLEARYRKASEVLDDLKGVQSEIASGIVAKYFRQKRRRKIYALAGGLAFVVGLAVLAFLGVFDFEALRQNDDSKHRIAILPFIVRGGEDLAYLENGMVDLLSIMLDGAGDLERVDPYALQSYISHQVTKAIDPETGRAIAKHFGAGLYVIGSVHGVGDQAQLSASLYDVKKGLIHNFQTKRLEKTQIDKLVDDLATQLVSLQNEVAANQLKSLASVTTASFAALKDYLEGESYIRAEKYIPACKSFQRAVEEDSTFALAYYRMNFVQAYSDDIFIDPQVAIERALRHTEKLSWRDISLFKAIRFLGQNKFMAARKLYQEIIDRYPDNAEAWYNLGMIDMSYGAQLGRSMEEARFALNKSLELNPEQPLALGFLQGTYVNEGRYKELIPLIERRNKIAPEGVFSETRDILAYLKGDTLLARRFLPEAKKAANINILVGAEWFASQEIFEGARNRAKILLEENRPLKWQIEGHLCLAYIDLTQGGIKKAMDEIEQARHLDAAFPEIVVSLARLTPMLEISTAKIHQEKNRTELLRVQRRGHKIARLYALGLFNAQVGDYQSASAYGDSLQSFANILQRQHADTALVVMARDRAHSVLAKIYFEQGSAEKAWEEMERMELDGWLQDGTEIVTSLAYERYLRAQILKSLGRYDDAMRWLSTLGNLSLSLCEIPYKAPKHFLLAEIYEALKQPEKAIEHYNYFINLWKDCDPELLPKVEEAKVRIARLKV
ncbi:MAG: Serine/threonine-protein kinase PknD [Syntrophorhabdaceae bacterium]|nr:Serine/threonine-protein kinase PknD [Syntrophorhabdaceae bacterium]